jgi:NhaP-type Na+/H+ and K+/H+ antiporter
VVQLLEGNAALAILAAAVVVGNAPALADTVGLQQDTRLSAGVQDAHAQITFIVKSFFFTFIGAMLGPPWDLVTVGIVFALLLLVARVPAVLLSTAGSGMTLAERRVVTVMFPRGMAAGVLALMPFGAGVPGTEQLPVVVFACVLFTILLFAIGLPITKHGLPPKAAPEEEARSVDLAVEPAPNPVALPPTPTPLGDPEGPHA